MKKKLFVFIAILGLVGLSTACSSDDKNDPAPPVTSIKYDGVYVGDLNISKSGLETQVQDKIEVIKTGDDRATLQLKNFSFQGDEIGDVIVENVKVSSKDKTVTLIGESRMNLIVGDCTIAVEATVIDDNLVATIDVVVKPLVSGGDTRSGDIEVKVTFEGVRTEVVASSEAKLLAFGLKDIETTYVIEGDKVTLTVQKTDVDKISKAIAVATISENATISPALDIE